MRSRIMPWFSFYVIALIAAPFGFGEIAAGAVDKAKMPFFILIGISAITFPMSLVRRP